MAIRLIDDDTAPEDVRETAKERLKASATAIVGAIVGAYAKAKGSTSGKDCNVCSKEAAKLKAAAGAAPAPK